jgi:hypothetical protein
LAEILKDVEAWNKSDTASNEMLGENTHVGFTHADRAIKEVNPFTTEFCKADLIRCSEVDPSAEIDSLEYYSKEYARLVRLLKVKQRWCHATPSDWFNEVNVLVTAIENDANDLDPWPPFSEWLTLFQVSIQGAAARRRSKMKSALINRLKMMAMMKMVENNWAVIELLQARSIRPAINTFSGVKLAVDLDCERRGSLLLGMIFEFA